MSPLANENEHKRLHLIMVTYRRRNVMFLSRDFLCLNVSVISRSGLFLVIKNRFKKTKGGGRRRGRKPFSSSLPNCAPKRSFPALSAYK